MIYFLIYSILSCILILISFKVYNAFNDLSQNVFHFILNVRFHNVNINIKNSMPITILNNIF